MWPSILFVAALSPPIPPLRPSSVVYGREPNIFKGVDDGKLLDPPQTLADELWHLRDRDDGTNLRHVEAENAYADAVLEQSHAWQCARDDVEERLLAYSSSSSDELLWHRGADQGGWEYASRHDEAHGPFPQYLRRPYSSTDSAAEEELLLDANAAPVELPSEYNPSFTFVGVVKGVSAFVPSPSGRFGAYTVDTTGEEKFSLMVVKLPVAGGQPEILASILQGTDVDVVWGADDSELFYCSMDETGRPYRLHRLEISAGGGGGDAASQAASKGFGGSGGSSSSKGKRKKSKGGKKSSSSSSDSGGGGGDSAGSDVVFEERDGRFRMSFRRASEGSRLLVELESRDGSEVWALPFGAKQQAKKEAWDSGFAAGGGWHCLGRREAGLSYSADYSRDGQYLLITNEGGKAEEGTLRVLSESDALAGRGRDGWRAAQAGDGSETASTLTGVQCFDGFAAIEGRYEGASVVYIWRYDDEEESMRRLDGRLLGGCDGPVGGGDNLLSDEGQWSVRLCAADEQRYDSCALRLEHSGPATPPRVLEVTPSADSSSPTIRVLKTSTTPEGFASDDYVCGRLYATAEDGVRIPISILKRRRRTATGDEEEDGPLPTLLYGYGSYGACTEAGWDADRLTLADCGMLHAICHVRGGGELGRGWHAAGRRERKSISFTDLHACAKRLVEAGLAKPGSIALEGRSAGGLLVGATLNLEPSLFAACLASVPFLDPLGTLQDASLPLTINEWEEFGNPNEMDGFESVKGFSPVQNVREGEEYPPCLFLPQLNDARTGWWEAHKFAHAIRSASRSSKAAPVLVCTGDGGHFRPADPKERASGRAMELGFVVAAVGGGLST